LETGIGNFRIAVDYFDVEMGLSQRKAIAFDIAIA
jgi:hypothetical protein